MKNFLMAFCAVVTSFTAFAGEVKITSVTAQQRYPLNGLVDISVTLQGTADDIAEAEWAFAATNSATKASLPVDHITQNDADVGSGTTWTRSFVWDAKADVGAVKIDDVSLTVSAVADDCVQLWENGPYWAKCNVGATKPEEYGYYFWWGDTVGYKRVGNSWNAVTGSCTGFQFDGIHCPTYGKTNDQLRDEGYIDLADNLIASHDAASVHLGKPWRLPTKVELKEMLVYCTSRWTIYNGVFGRVINGVGDYASKNIFLPAAGCGISDRLDHAGETGYYWFSAPNNGYTRMLWLSSGLFLDTDLTRHFGGSVRPVRNDVVDEIRQSVVTTHFAFVSAEMIDETPKTSAITYTNLKGATHSNPATYEEGISIEFSAPSAVDGYTFVGWEPAAITPDTTGDVIVTSKWRRADGGPYAETVDGVEYTFSISNGEATIGNGYPAAIPTSTSGELVIPSTLGGCPVTTIGGFAFSRCTSLTSITIPDSVTEIGPYAFEDCSSLTSVTIPDSVTKIGLLAFRRCKSLADVRMSENVSYLGGRAFYDTPFYDSLPEGFIVFGTALYEYKGDCPKEIEIPDGVTMIAAGAFGANLISVTIPSSVKYIESHAFLSCRDTLARVNITDVAAWCDIDFVDIGMEGYLNPLMFAHHLYLNGEEIRDLIIPSGVVEIKYLAFECLTSLRSVTIPNSVTTIGSYAFSGCSSLTTVYVDKGDAARVKELMRGKGVDVDKLTFIEPKLPDGGPYTETVEGVEWKFFITNGEATIGSGDWNVASVNNTVAGTLIIPSVLGGCSVTSIGTRAFLNCKSLETLVIPNSIAHTSGYNILDGCDSLTKIVGWMPRLSRDSIEEIEIYERNTIVPVHCFASPSQDLELRSFIVEGGTIEIEDTAFYGRPKLETVYISVENGRIVGGNFEDCKALTSLTLKGVRVIGGGSFTGCSSLATLTLQGVEDIGGGSFMGCSSLTTLTLQGVEEIGRDAFSGCSSLTTVYVDKGDTSRIRGLLKAAGLDVDTLTFVEPKLPDGGPYTETVDGVEYTFSISNGEATIGTGEWRKPAISASTSGALVIPSMLGGCPVTEIGEFAFDCCYSLLSITIPDSVTTIGSWAFLDCSSLTSFNVSPYNQNFTSVNGLLCSKDGTILISGINGDVTIPDSVTTIGEDAFCGRSSLTSVSIPDSVTTIGGEAFYGCSSLISVTIPDSVVAIEWYAFDGCSSLASFEIPKGMINFQWNALLHCDSIVSITIPSSIQTFNQMGGGSFYGRSLKVIHVAEGDTERVKMLLRECREFEADVNQLMFVEPGEVYSSITYTNLMGATHTNPDTYKEGEKLTFAAPSGVEGYEFVGWEPAAITPDTTGDVVVTAKWTPNAYSIAFNANGGEGEMAAQAMTYDVAANLAANGFTKTGYHFVGWASEAEGEVVYADGAEVKNLAINGALELYAKWEANAYSIAFNANGGEGEMAAQAMAYDVAACLAANGFTKTGYHFVGWASEAEGEVVHADGTEVKNLATNGAVELHAKWEANVHSITFNANGGEGEMVAQTMTYDVAANLAANGFTKTGYHFVGWASEADGEVIYADGTEVKNLATNGAVELYAKWEANAYSIAFNANGGEGEMAAQTMTYDVAANLAANGFMKTGYHFVGWASEVESEVVYADGAEVKNLATNGAVELHAKWEANAYSIAFNANGGEGEMAAQTMTYDVAANLAANGFTKIGYHFVGWASEAEGEVVYADGTEVKNLATNGAVELYAKWEANTYTIHYVANGGVGEMATTTAIYDGNLRLPANEFAFADHTFLGWSTTEFGEVEYGDQAQIPNLTTNEGATVSLYAVWRDDSSPEPPAFVPPTWEQVNKEDTMAVFATVYDRSEKAFVEAEGSLLAAFDAKGECRGVVEIMDGPLGRLFMLSVGVESESETGIVLKLWNAATGEIIEVGEKIASNSEKQIGEIFAPQIFYVGAVEQKLTLKEGWNWVATGVSADDNNVSSIFDGAAFANGDMIKSVSKMTTYYAGSWYPSVFAINPGEAYMIHKTSAGDEEVVVLGDVMENRISVKSGWNWIGSTVQTEQSVGRVVHSAGFANGDMIKGVSKFTTYYNGNWYPSDFTITPGVGYKAKMAHVGDLSIAEANPMSRRLKLAIPMALPEAPVAPSFEPVAQEDTMAIYATVLNADRTPIDENGSLLVAFSATGECRGVIGVMDGPLGKIYSLSVGVASATEKGFVLKIWNATSGELLEIEETVDCNAEKQLGLLWEPVVFHVKSGVDEELTLEKCLNVTDLTFVTSGDAQWFGETSVTHDGVGAVQSGAIGDNQTSRLETTVVGPGTVAFWWKVDCEAYRSYKLDHVSFYIDGVEQKWINGTKDWMQESFEVAGAGSHILAWVYEKDEEGAEGADCAWVDEVVWTSTAITLRAGDDSVVQENEPTDEELSLYVPIPVNDAAAAQGQAEILKVIKKKLSNGLWAVSVDLDVDKMPKGKKIDDTATAFATHGLARAAGAMSEQSIPLPADSVTPGAYYSVVYGETADKLDREGVRTLATREGVSVHVPPMNDKRVYYIRLKASACP